MGDGHDDDPDLNAVRIEYTRYSRRVMRRVRMRDPLRRLLKPQGGLPSLIVIGAQKSGTSSLFDALSQHPRLARGVRKEVHFFNENYLMGEGWYRTFFPPEDGRFAFEATPDYMVHPHAADRICATLPGAKLVAILREPVARALSHYWMEWMRGNEHLGIEAAFAAEARRLPADPGRALARSWKRSHALKHHSYFYRGLYADQLRPFLELQGRDKVLVLRAEDFATAPVATLDRICDFAGVPRFVPPILRRVNVGRAGDVMSRSPKALQQELRTRYARPNRDLAELVGVTWDSADGVPV